MPQTKKVYKNKSNSFSASVSEKSNDSNLVTMEKGGNRVAWSLQGNRVGQGTVPCPAKSDELLALDVANWNLDNGGDLIFTGKGAATNRFFIDEKISESIVSQATYQDNGNYLHTGTVPCPAYFFILVKNKLHRNNSDIHSLIIAKKY